MMDNFWNKIILQIAKFGKQFYLINDSMWNMKQVAELGQLKGITNYYKRQTVNF